MAAGLTGLFGTAGAPLIYVAIFATFIVLLWALVAFRRTARTTTGIRRTADELEAALNEAEAALAAEPNILLIWRGREGEPDRVINNMHGAAKIPDDTAGIVNFAGWLELESANALVTAIAQMRDSGSPFNVGIKTIEGELLEADGRTARARPRSASGPWPANAPT